MFKEGGDECVFVFKGQEWVALIKVPAKQSFSQYDERS